MTDAGFNPISPTGFGNGQFDFGNYGNFGAGSFGSTGIDMQKIQAQISPGNLLLQSAPSILLFGAGSAVANKVLGRVFQGAAGGAETAPGVINMAQNSQGVWQMASPGVTGSPLFNVAKRVLPWAGTAAGVYYGGQGVINGNPTQGTFGGALGGASFGATGIGVSALPTTYAGTLAGGNAALAGGVAGAGIFGGGALAVNGYNDISQAGHSFWGDTKTIGGAALAGAAVGSIIPGVGTAVGAVVGGLVGAAGGGIAALVAGHNHHVMDAQLNQQLNPSDPNSVQYQVGAKQDFLNHANAANFSAMPGLGAIEQQIQGLTQPKLATPEQLSQMSIDEKQQYFDGIKKYNTQLNPQIAQAQAQQQQQEQMKLQTAQLQQMTASIGGGFGGGLGSFGGGLNGLSGLGDLGGGLNLNGLGGLGGFGGGLNSFGSFGEGLNLNSLLSSIGNIGSFGNAGLSGLQMPSIQMPAMPKF